MEDCRGEECSKMSRSIQGGELVGNEEILLGGEQSLKPSNSLLEGSFPGMTIMNFLSLISTLIYSYFQLFFWALIC